MCRRTVHCPHSAGASPLGKLAHTTPNPLVANGQRVFCCPSGGRYQMDTAPQSPGNVPPTRDCRARYTTPGKRPNTLYALPRPRAGGSVRPSMPVPRASDRPTVRARVRLSRLAPPSPNAKTPSESPVNSAPALPADHMVVAPHALMGVLQPEPAHSHCEPAGWILWSISQRMGAFLKLVSNYLISFFFFFFNKRAL
jgi:hypothetical protein